EIESLFAEIFARGSALQRGRAGSFHLADPALGFPYTSALVGGPVPLACGMAWARKYRGRDGIAFTCFGEGALGEGVVSECLKIAKMGALPVVLVCESKEEPVGDNVNRWQSAARLVELAEAHRVQTVSVDGTQPLAVDQAVEAVVADVRAGNGP